MRAVTLGPFDWAVKADWFGAERTVYVGTLQGCIDWIVANE